MLWLDHGAKYVIKIWADFSAVHIGAVFAVDWFVKTAK
jgi:hypothetical protein